MIYESYPWKQDLLRRKRLIQQYNYPELLGDDNDRAYTVIEKAIFYSAFIIRKLIDCKGKVSDEVDKYSFTIKGLQPEKEVNFMNRWPENGNYDWEHEVTYTKPGTDICNWLIHSYVFFATVYKGNIIKNLIMDCQSYTKYRPNETTGGIFVSWRRKEELPTGA